MIKLFDVHKCLLNGQSIIAGQLAIESNERKQFKQIQFKYSQAYLNHPAATPLMPSGMALTSSIIDIPTDGKALPGFIDDCLPDDWGRKIVAMKLKKRFIDTLTLMENMADGSAIGALKITNTGESAQWHSGIEYQQAKSFAQLLWQGHLQEIGQQYKAINLILSGGSRAGGARPKLLAIDENNNHCLVKFNRQQDRFNVAALEWACLQVFKLAHVPCAHAEIDTFSTDQSQPLHCLKVQRFDISPQGGRYALLTINALLKNHHTQEDPLYGSYEDIAEIIRSHSYQPQQDLEQLFAQLLINQALLNTDDHLRNFSILQDEKGWRLSPVYDVVPDESFAREHAIAFNGSAFLPNLEQALETGKRFQLPKPVIQKVIKNVTSALGQWPELLKAVGVTDERLLGLVKIKE